MVSALTHVWVPFCRLRAMVLCGLIALTLLGGCASTGNPRDPLEPINRGIYHFNDGVDHLLLKPAAEIYRGVLPQFARTGVSNFFSNIGDVIVALNNLLQGKFGQAVSDVGRIVVNTTSGLLGLIDVATEIGLEKHNEDFGQTLGYWGIGDGPYLVLPFLGPERRRSYARWRLLGLVLVSALCAIGVLHQPLWIPILTAFVPLVLIWGVPQAGVTCDPRAAARA